MCVALLALLLGICSSVLAQEPNALVGNWKLVSRQTIVDGEAAPPDLFGSNPRGYLILTREGRMALIITGENRKGG
jgi:Lipocalin-like domain